MEVKCDRCGGSKLEPGSDSLTCEVCKGTGLPQSCGPLGTGYVLNNIKGWNIKGGEPPEPRPYEPQDGEMYFPIQCIECKKVDRVQVAYPQDAFTTCMGYPEHTDKEGRHHYHDGNRVTRRYECPYGHSFEIQTVGTCWCGWPEKYSGEHHYFPSKGRGVTTRLSDAVRGILKRVANWMEPWMKQTDGMTEEGTALFDDVMGLLDPQRPRPRPPSSDGMVEMMAYMDIGMGIVNTACMPGHPNEMHRRFLFYYSRSVDQDGKEKDHLAKVAYGRVWEAQRMLQDLWWREKGQSPKWGPHHPAIEVRTMLEQVIAESAPKLTEDMRDTLEYQQRKLYERKLTEQWERGRANRLRDAVELHNRQCEGAGCPLYEHMKQLTISEESAYKTRANKEEPE